MCVYIYTANQTLNSNISATSIPNVMSSYDAWLKAKENFRRYFSMQRIKLQQQCRFRPPSLPGKKTTFKSFLLSLGSGTTAENINVQRSPGSPPTLLDWRHMC